MFLTNQKRSAGQISIKKFTLKLVEFLFSLKIFRNYVLPFYDSFSNRIRVMLQTFDYFFYLSENDKDWNKRKVNFMLFFFCLFKEMLSMFTS